MQNNELKSTIQSLIPELEKALEIGIEDSVIVSGQTISRKEAERILSEFKSYISSDRTYHLPWDILPLKLVVSNNTWRLLQKELNEMI